MIIYYSGTPSEKHGHPETLLREREGANVMISYSEISTDSSLAVRRLRRIVEVRENQ